MKDLYDARLRGHLPLLIQNFLSDRRIRVRVGNTYSNVYSQEMGVPQGSILSVTLVSIKINSLVKRLPFGMQCSLYVNDFVISYSSAFLKTLLSDKCNNVSIRCNNGLMKMVLSFPRLRQFVFTFVVREDYTRIQLYTLMVHKSRFCKRLNF